MDCPCIVCGERIPEPRRSWKHTKTCCPEHQRRLNREGARRRARKRAARDPGPAIRLARGKKRREQQTIQASLSPSSRGQSLAARLSFGGGQNVEIVGHLFPFPTSTYWPFAGSRRAGGGIASPHGGKIASRVRREPARGQYTRSGAVGGPVQEPGNQEHSEK